MKDYGKERNQILRPRGGIFGCARVFSNVNSSRIAVSGCLIVSRVETRSIAIVVVL